MRTRLVLVTPIALSCLVVLAPGCGSGGDTPMDAGPPDLTPPPAICKTPTPPSTTGGAWFTDVTADWLPNADGDPKAAPSASSVRAADLDGDGYPDLITTGGEGFPKRPAMGTGGRRDTKGSRTRNVWMNRPDPADPTGKARIFVDATEDSHLSDTRDGVGGYAYSVASVGDVDNDGDPDVVLGPSDAPDANHDGDDPGGCALNDGHGHFHLAPAGSDLDAVYGFAAGTSTLNDFDRDGVLDYVPGTFVYPPPNQIPPMFLLGNGDGTFVNVPDKWMLPTDCSQGVGMGPPCAPDYGLTACDLDMDGDTDLLFASYGREPNQVWINDGMGHFSGDVGVMTGIAYDDRMDFSDDQSYRCYCQNRPGKCMPQPPAPAPGICTGFGIPGAMDGRGWFPGVSDVPWNLGGNNYSLVCGDIDNDGDMDIMTSTIRHGDVGSASDPSELVINDTPPGMPLGKFRRPGPKATGIDRTSYEVGINWNEGDLTATMGDLDNDGLKDIYICSSDYPGDHGWFFHQKADHTFEGLTKVSALGQKEPHGIALFDMDKDGDLDIAMGTSTFRNGAPYAVLKVYRNDVGAQQNWVQIDLVGLGKGHTNVSALGALVKVTAGGVTQMMDLQGGHSSSQTQNEHVLTFGLGASCTIDKVEVRWLDAKNTVQTFQDVRANYRVRIREGQSYVEYL